MRPSSPRVALVSIGIGRVQRGFEKYFTELSQLLCDEIDVTLCRSGGPPFGTFPRERVPAGLSALTKLAGKLPLGPDHPSYHRDCIAYGLAILPDLLRGRYDVVHTIDPPLAVVLHRLRKIVPFSARLLFTDGCVVPLKYYGVADHVHQVSQVHLARVIAGGISPSRVTLVEVGLHSTRFEAPATVSELRRKHGVPGGTFVILAISAVKRDHKRVDHIIEEVSRLDGDVLLWIDGNPEDSAVVELANRKLGSRCRITHVPTNELPDLYHLADVFVQASLEEAFGLAVAEAMASGLMVLVNDTPHFAWLTQDPRSLVDMRTPGSLSGRLNAIMARRSEYAEVSGARRAYIRERFDWLALKHRYVDMYRKVAALPASGSEAPLEVSYER